MIEAAGELLEVQQVSGAHSTETAEDWMRRIMATRKALLAAKTIETT